MDSEYSEFAVLLEILQKELIESDDPYCDVMDTRYNPLLTAKDVSDVKADEMKKKSDGERLGVKKKIQLRKKRRKP